MVTDSKIAGTKVVFRSDTGKMIIFSAQYTFDTGFGKLIILAVSLEEDFAAYEKLLDASMKTFQIAK
jgi:hypothetical protein